MSGVLLESQLQAGEDVGRCPIQSVLGPIAEKLLEMVVGDGCGVGCDNMTICLQRTVGKHLVAHTVKGVGLGHIGMDTQSSACEVEEVQSNWGNELVADLSFCSHFLDGVELSNFWELEDSAKIGCLGDLMYMHHLDEVVVCVQIAWRRGR